MPSAKAYFFRVYFLYWKRIQEFSRGMENLLKNVERRGKPSTWLPRQKLAEERIPAPETDSLITPDISRASWLNSRIFNFFRIFKIFRSQNRSAGRGITRPIVYVWSRGFACLHLKHISRTRFFYIENEFRNFPGERKIYSKILVNCRPSIIVFFLPGVLLTESSSPLQVTWDGAVNRQPSYRTRNCQRLTYGRKRIWNAYNDWRYMYIGFNINFCEFQIFQNF